MTSSISHRTYAIYHLSPQQIFRDSGSHLPTTSYSKASYRIECHNRRRYLNLTRSTIFLEMSKQTRPIKSNACFSEPVLKALLVSAAEFSRLDDQANGYIELMHSKIVHAPLDKPRKLIDVGCGTGIVCRQLAQQYPAATVLGVDISPVPPHPKTPENVEYILGDIYRLAGNDERLQNEAVDYVYQRLLICGMTDWPGYVQRMARLLCPGGFLEIHDYAELWYEQSAQPDEEDHFISGDWKWQKAMRRGAAQLGLDLDVGLNAARYMKDVGLVDVQTVKYKVPSGTWLAADKPETKKIGQHQDVNMGEIFSNSILPGVTRELDIGEEHMKELKDECRRCLKGEEGKFCWFYVTWGRKV